MTKPANPTRKGDAIAIEVRHSYQQQQGGRVEYSRFYLGTVFKASRDGVASMIVQGAGGAPQRVSHQKVYAIMSAPHQAAALRLLANMTYPGTEWDTAEAIKAAIQSEIDSPAPTQFPEYREFMAADEAWSRVLDCEFGARAGDVRYTAEGKGEVGSVLRSALERREAARVAWEAIRDKAA